MTEPYPEENIEIQVHEPSTRAPNKKREKKPKDYKVGKNKPPVEHQFKEGQAPGPGRPPGSLSLIGLLKKRLAELNPENKRTYAEQFIDNVLQDAMDLDGPSRKLVMQYIEGMPKQQMLIDTSKNTLDDLTDFFRSVARGESIKAAEPVVVPIDAPTVVSEPPPLPATPTSNESGGPTSA